MTRKTAALAVGTALLVVSLILVAVPSLGLQPYGLASSIGILALFLIIAIQSSMRQHRAVLRELARLDDRMSRVEYRTLPIHDIRGSVVKTSAASDEALIHLRELADQGFVAGSTSEGTLAPHTAHHSERSVFGPETISAVAIQGRATAHVAGRNAARHENDGSSERNLTRIMQASDTERQREIALVGRGPLQDRLAPLGTITQLYPGTGTAGLPASLAYVIVDLPTIASSPWRGVLDASGSRLFTELHTLLTEARKRGAVILMHGQVPPSHFTASITSLAHVVVDNGPASTRWGSDVEADVIRALTGEPAGSNSDAEGAP